MRSARRGFGAVESHYCERNVMDGFSLRPLSIVAVALLLTSGAVIARVDDGAESADDRADRALVFRQIEIRFGPNRNGLQTRTTSASFTRAVKEAHAVITGFDLEFASGGHDFQRAMVDIAQTRISGNSVDVKAILGLKDSSGHFDDDFHGWIKILLMVELA
jgi:hypothetical protein